MQFQFFPLATKTLDCWKKYLKITLLFKTSSSSILRTSYVCTSWEHIQLGRQDFESAKMSLHASKRTWSTAMFKDELPVYVTLMEL